MSTASIFGALALFPALLGPLPAGERGASLILELCHGGTIAISLGEKGGTPQGFTPCCAKGCRSEDKSQKFGRRLDPRQ